MRRRYLLIKVWFILTLQQLGLLQKRWHKSEIELAKIEGERLAAFFNQDAKQ